MSITVPPGYVNTSPTKVGVSLVFGVAKIVNFGLRPATPTPGPTETGTPTPTQTPTEGPTPTPTQTPTEGPTPTPTQTPAQTSTPTATPTETPRPRLNAWVPMVIYVSPSTQPPLTPFLMPVVPPGDRPSFILSWTPIYATRDYELQESREPSFAAPVERVYTGDATSFEARSHGIGTHYYRVRARNLAGESNWSEAQPVPVSWETEPNNVLPEANPGLLSNSTLYALPDDPDDFFSLTTSESGPIIARVDNVAATGVRLSLYYDNIGNLIASDTTAPYQVSAVGPAGTYYVRVFAEAGYTATTPYRLIATFR